MDDSTLELLLSRLSQSAFKTFIADYYNSKYYSDHYEHPVTPISEIGNNVYHRGLLQSYGGNLHWVFVLQYLPLSLIQHPEKYLLKNEELINNLKKLRDYYKGKKGSWGMVSESLRSDYQLQTIHLITNLHSLEKEVYFQSLLPEFKAITDRIFRRKTLAVALGSYDSFIELSDGRIRNAFEDFLRAQNDGILISLSDNKPTINYFAVENSLLEGVMSKTRLPYEPLFVNRIKQSNDTLNEFSSLICSNASEAALEKFLAANYKEIFGNKYDRIETQLWLRFPEIDISAKERKLDIFLRNSVLNDWELFELKRAVKLTNTYRDVPVLRAEVLHAIQQTKNYAKLLSQDKIKKHFAKQGIEFFEPVLNLVIGRTPQISHAEWRWLTSSEKEVKILTYDNLLREMRLRHKDRMGYVKS